MIASTSGLMSARMVRSSAAPGFKEEWIQTPFYANDAVSQSVSALLFVGLCLYVWFGSLRKAAEAEK